MSLAGGAEDREAITALESRLATVEQAAEQQVGQVTEFGERLAAVETAPAPVDDQLTQRLGELEQQLAGLGEVSSGDGDDEALGERMTEQLAAMEQRIETLAADLQAATEAQQAAQQANATALGSIETTMPSLQQSLTAASETVATLGTDVQTLASRVGEAESRLDHLGGEYQRGAAMIVAIGDVGRAVARSEPFADALTSLKSLLRDETVLGETLSTLEPVAADGVPSLGDLQGSFGATASQALLAEEGDRSLADQVGDNVFGIINMRPSGGDAEGSDSRAILSRAQGRLAAGDLEAALGELDALEGAAAEAAAPWVERARSRLAAEAAVADLRSHAQSLVAKGT